MKNNKNGKNILSKYKVFETHLCDYCGNKFLLTELIEFKKELFCSKCYDEKIKEKFINQRLRKI